MGRLLLFRTSCTLYHIIVMVDVIIIIIKYIFIIVFFFFFSSSSSSSCFSFFNLSFDPLNWCHLRQPVCYSGNYAMCHCFKICYKMCIWNCKTSMYPLHYYPFFEIPCENKSECGIFLLGNILYQIKKLIGSRFKYELSNENILTYVQFHIILPHLECFTFIWTNENENVDSDFSFAHWRKWFEISHSFFLVKICPKSREKRNTSKNSQ